MIHSVLPTDSAFWGAQVSWKKSLNAENSRVWQNKGAFYGCTLSAQADILVAAGYVLLEVDGWDAIYVPRSLAHLFQPLFVSVEAAYEAGFASTYVPTCFVNDPQVVSKKLMALGSELAVARTRHRTEQLVQEVRQVLEAQKASSNLAAVPFHLAVDGPSDHLYPTLFACPVSA